MILKIIAKRLHNILSIKCKIIEQIVVIATIIVRYMCVCVCVTDFQCYGVGLVKIFVTVFEGSALLLDILIVRLKPKLCLNILLLCTYTKAKRVYRPIDLNWF